MFWFTVMPIEVEQGISLVGSYDSPYKSHDRSDGKICNGETVIFLITNGKKDGSCNHENPVNDIEKRKYKFVFEIIFKIFDVHLRITIKKVNIKNINNKVKENYVVSLHLPFLMKPPIGTFPDKQFFK